MKDGRRFTFVPVLIEEEDDGKGGRGELLPSQPPICDRAAFSVRAYGGQGAEDGNKVVVLIFFKS